MIKRILFLFFNSLIILMVGTSLTFAALGDQGPASVYKITITKFEIYDGTFWTTLIDGSSVTIDIAAVDAGSVAGSFFTGLNVADGTYTQVRVTVSNTFAISGNVGGLYTLSTKTMGACDTGAEADEVECSIDVPGAGLPAPTADVLPTTLTVTDGVASHKIRVNFNVSMAIEEVAGPTLIPATPTVTMTMIPR